LKNWDFEYFCRIEGQGDFPSMKGQKLSIDDPNSRIFKSSCFINGQSQTRYRVMSDEYFCLSLIEPTALWNYTGLISNVKSSLVLASQAFGSNRTYQWWVTATHRYDPLRQAHGSLFVHVEDQQQQTIVLGYCAQLLLSHGITDKSF
jgi:hypothetical protein